MGVVVSTKKIGSFQKKILSFYTKNKRDLPWRNTTDAYKIWISEVMLQQTQVDRVVEYYNTWVRRWPIVASLAQASREDVLRAWQGLGYNNRAVNVHRAAETIVNEFGGDVIAAMRDFKRVSGVGPYTSAAVRIFSCNENIATVDTNIRRILIAEFGLSESVSDTVLFALAARCVPKGRSCVWHNALMDYGALHFTSRRSGIKPKSVQSRFEGSDRQVRASIVRAVLNQGSVGLVDVFNLCGKNRSRAKLLLDGLVKDGVLKKSGSRFLISDK